MSQYTNGLFSNQNFHFWITVHTQFDTSKLHSRTLNSQKKTKNHQKLLTLIYFLGLPVTHPNVSIHSAAETLLLSTESLREPVIPHSIQ